MNRTAIEALYRRHGPMVLRRARSILGDEQASKDAMQEVFIRAIQSGDEFRGDASPITWLYKITTNYCLNQIRNSSRRRDLWSENAPTGDADASSSFESRYEVGQLLQGAPPDLREIAVYYYLDDLKHEEIASLLNISRRTVGNRLDAFRAYAQAELVPNQEKSHE